MSFGTTPKGSTLDGSGSTPCVAACSLPPATGRYSGASPACEGGFGPSSTLVRTGRSFAYAPSDGVIVIPGELRAGGELSGSLSLRPSNPSLDAGHGATNPRPGQHRVTLVLAVSGQLDPEAVVLNYVAGACHVTLTLARVHPGLL